MTESLFRRSLTLVGENLVTANTRGEAAASVSSNVTQTALGSYALPEEGYLLCEKGDFGAPLLVRYGLSVGVLLGLRTNRLDNPALRLNIHDPRGPPYFRNRGYPTSSWAPVTAINWRQLANTAGLAGVAFAITVPRSMLLGIPAGMGPASFLDRALSVASIMMTSMPEYSIGIILAAIFAVWLKVLPGTSPLVGSSGWPLSHQFVPPVVKLPDWLTSTSSKALELPKPRRTWGS